MTKMDRSGNFLSGQFCLRITTQSTVFAPGRFSLRIMDRQGNMFSSQLNFFIAGLLINEIIKKGFRFVIKKYILKNGKSNIEIYTTINTKHIYNTETDTLNLCRKI